MSHPLLESAWNRGGKPMTKEEAAYVWMALHRLVGTHPEGRRLLRLFETLEREAIKGERCSVCGRHASENYDCSNEC